MDYEKKYNEALERAKAYHRNELAGSRKEMMEYIFPELRESEDERMRRKTINCLIMHNKGCVDAKDIEECIAWLEKQKEQKPIEQDSEEVFDKIDKSFRKGREVGFQEGVESVKPAEWSEEDEVLRQDCIRFIETGWTDNGKSHLIPWLKSLPERFNLQPKQERNEEEKTIIEGACSALEIYGHTKLASRLKSLRPCPSWKPSKEQMEELVGVLRILPPGETYHILLSLYNDLKKL